MSSLPTSPDAKVNTSGGGIGDQERTGALLRVATDTDLGQATLSFLLCEVGVWSSACQNSASPYFFVLCTEEDVGVPGKSIALVCFISQVHGGL